MKFACLHDYCSFWAASKCIYCKSLWENHQLNRDIVCLNMADKYVTTKQVNLCICPTRSRTAFLWARKLFFICSSTVWEPVFTCCSFTLLDRLKLVRLSPPITSATQLTQTLDDNGLKMVPVYISLTAAFKNRCFVQRFFFYLGKSSFDSRTGAILPKVKDVLLWANRKRKACIPLPRRVEIYSLLITTHTHTRQPSSLHACVQLIPVLWQWTSPWSCKIIFTS